MTIPVGRAISWVLEVALLATTCANHAGAQSDPRQSTGEGDRQHAGEVLKTIDQLVEQNRKLEQQNQELIKQLEKVRAFIVLNADPALTNPSSRNTPQGPQGGESPSAATTTPATAVYIPVSSTPSNRTQPSAPPPPPQQPSTTGQNSSQNQGNGDDKTLLPEPSDGNSAIFGEFNPGRGFTVAKGEYGELNLSGYMAVRY